MIFILFGPWSNKKFELETEFSLSQLWVMRLLQFSQYNQQVLINDKISIDAMVYNQDKYCHHKLHPDISK